MKMPYGECPSFDVCSCSVCPLDPDFEDKILSKEVGDLEYRCRAQKPTRIRIANKYPDILPMGGLNLREFTNKTRWESKSPEERMKITQRLENARRKAQEGLLQDLKHGNI